MLNAVKHLAWIGNINPFKEVSKMLHCVQHDVQVIPK